jgi:diguanylate cyclase (GGDEF)-like protein
MSEEASSDRLGLVDQAVRETLARLLDENEALKARIADLERLADTDPLTPLPNRRAFVREVERAIARVTRYGTGIAMMYVDVDNLKMINDAYGHGAGDAALNHVAAMLRSGVRAGDLVARVGGDEFALLVEPVDAEAARVKADALRTAAMAGACEWNGQMVAVGVSIGVAMIEADDSVDSLFARADAGMYAAKNGQRSER